MSFKLSRRPPPAKPKARRRRRRVVLALGALLLPCIGFLLLDWWFPLRLPTPGELYSQVVVDRHGRPLRAFADGTGVWRYEVALEDISPYYIEALLTYEDRRFWWHPGVDPLALVRAAGLWLEHGRVVSGGSTITMQVGRLLHPHRRTLPGKLHQAFRALQLEWHLSKREILTLYCNIAPFGGTLEGVQAASFTYLGKPAHDLTRAEAALLAVLPQSPTRLRPDLHPQVAEQARAKVLARLVDYKVWQAADAQAAALEPVYALHKRIEPHASLLAQRLANASTARVVHTSIDYAMQLAVEDYLRLGVAKLPPKTTAAALVVENATGLVRAYAGTGDFANPERFGHVDMVPATRSPGSTLKPFLYGFALEDGLIHEQSLLVDAPLIWQGYKPQNFNGGFAGPVTAAEALQRSLNVPAVDLLDRFGLARFVDRLAQGGLHLEIPGGANHAVILGGAGASLEGLTAAYTAFTNNGVARQLRFSEQAPNSSGRYLMSPAGAWVVYHMLRDVPPPGPLKRVAGLGDAQRIAWKTGTSYGMRDAWALGFDRTYTIGVWVGRPDGSFVPDNTGRSAAGPLLFALADYLLPRPQAVPKPVNVNRAEVCWPLGVMAAEVDSSLCPVRKSAWLIDQAAPPTWRERGVALTPNPLPVWLAGGKRVNGSCYRPEAVRHEVALWPAALEPWLPHTYRRAALLAPLASACRPELVSAQPLAITDIIEQSQFRRPANRSEPVTLRLAAVGGVNHHHWYANGRFLFTLPAGHSQTLALTEPGPLQLLVVDDVGNLDKRQVWVK